MSKPNNEYTKGNYFIGFTACLTLTLLAYFSVANNKFSDNVTLYWIAWLAFVQFVVQLVFFLHLGRERQTPWKLISFGLMTIIVTALVAGTLWIMVNLNYHHPDHNKSSDDFIIKDEGIRP